MRETTSLELFSDFILSEGWRNFLDCDLLRISRIWKFSQIETKLLSILSGNWRLLIPVIIGIKIQRPTASFSDRDQKKKPPRWRYACVLVCLSPLLNRGGGSV